VKVRENPEDRVRRFDVEVAGRFVGEQDRRAIDDGASDGQALLLADEPTGNLDIESADAILGIFADFHRVGVTVVVATHDQHWIQRYHPNVLCLDHGRMAA